VEISPAPLNRGEKLFVEDLREYYNNNTAFFADHELYLLRNLSKGRGIGFFEAGNFHPDFLLWLMHDGRQRIIFIDPKGIRNIGFDDPKIRFCETVKEIEARLRGSDPTITLDSFIISNTPVATMQGLWGIDKTAMMTRNIVFQVDDRDKYISQILTEKPYAVQS
ncbi:MAG: DEAD/DEAH box helicase, partial [Acidobacteria bacterium]|nr:DEAD/DEAH box helicase [Acidobacteriota bacterium]